MLRPLMFEDTCDDFTHRGLRYMLYETADGIFAKYRPDPGLLIVDGIEYRRTHGYCEGAMISLKSDSGCHTFMSFSQPPTESEVNDWVRNGNRDFDA